MRPSFRKTSPSLLRLDGDVARRLCGVGVPLERGLADLEAARVVAQGQLGVTRLATPGEEVAELVEADRDVALPPVRSRGSRLNRSSLI